MVFWLQNKAQVGTHQNAQVDRSLRNRQQAQEIVLQKQALQNQELQNQARPKTQVKVAQNRHLKSQQEDRVNPRQKVKANLQNRVHLSGTK